MRTIIFMLAIMLTSQLAFAVEPGVYYCVTERMAGIQPERETKEGENIHELPRFVGKITPVKEKFVVKIRAIDKAERTAKCDVTPPPPEGFQIVRPINELLFCSLLVDKEAILPEAKFATLDIINGHRLFSGDGGIVFTTGATTTLWIYQDLRYQLSQLGGVHGNYVEEGYCETFE